MQDRSPQDKMVKTAILFGAYNVVVMAIAGRVSSSLWLPLTLAANVFALYKFNELGKERRIGQNFVTKSRSFFSSHLPEGAIETNEIENTFSNILNGGAAIADEVMMQVGKFMNKPS